jgi:hypothetical protein
MAPITLRSTTMTTTTENTVPVTEPAELRIHIDTDDPLLCWADTYPEAEATHLALELSSPGLVATLVVPTTAARSWAGELYEAVSVAHREATGDPTRSPIWSFRACLLPMPTTPGPGLVVQGDEEHPAMVRFHVALDIEGICLSTAELRAGLVEALSKRFNTARAVVSAGEAISGRIT